jgi:hypothetical protein
LGLACRDNPPGTSTCFSFDFAKKSLSFYKTEHVPLKTKLNMLATDFLLQTQNRKNFMYNDPLISPIKHQVLSITRTLQMTREFIDDIPNSPDGNEYPHVH